MSKINGAITSRKITQIEGLRKNMGKLFLVKSQICTNSGRLRSSQQ